MVIVNCVIIHSGGSKGGARDARIPLRVRFLFIFMRFLAEIWKNNRLNQMSPSGGLAPPPGLGNSGSTTHSLHRVLTHANDCVFRELLQNVTHRSEHFFSFFQVKVSG